jgi:hypothetical protein
VTRRRLHDPPVPDEALAPGAELFETTHLGFDVVRLDVEVDLGKKLAEWERFYNDDRPHGAHRGKTPYKALREKLR